MSEIQSSELFRSVLESLQIGIVVTDRSGKILFWNQGAEHLAGHIGHEVIGRSHQDSILEHCRGEGCNECGKTCPFTRTLHQGKPTETRMQIHHKQGHLVPVVLRIAAIRDPHGSVVATAAILEAQQPNAQRDRDQRHPVPPGCVDEATGVANRDFTEFHLRENFEGFAKYRVPFAIIQARADGLEHFRGSYGRQASDAALRVIAQNLSNNFRPSDFIGRWAEDEFLAILMNCSALGAEQAFERVHKMAASSSIRWWGEQLTLTAYLGYAAVEPGDTIDSLLQRAERSRQAGSKTGVESDHVLAQAGGRDQRD